MMQLVHVFTECATFLTWESHQFARNSDCPKLLVEGRSKRGFTHSIRPLDNIQSSAGALTALKMNIIIGPIELCFHGISS